LRCIDKAAHPRCDAVAIDNEQNYSVFAGQRRAGGTDAGGGHLADAADRRRKPVAGRGKLERITADAVCDQPCRRKPGAGRRVSGQHTRASGDPGPDTQRADGGPGRGDGATVCDAGGNAKDRRLVAHELGAGRFAGCAVAQRQCRQRAARGLQTGRFLGADAGARLCTVQAARLNNQLQLPLNRGESNAPPLSRGGREGFESNEKSVFLASTQRSRLHLHEFPRH